MNIYLLTCLAVAAFSANALALDVVKCQNLRWKLIEKGTPATYRGSVKAGSAKVLDIEIRNSKGIIGQTKAFPNAGGNWQARVWGDYRIKRSHRVKIYCKN